MRTIHKNLNVAGYSETELKEMKKQFDSDLEQSQKVSKSFQAMILDILGNENGKDFSDRTGLNPNMLTRFKYYINKNDPPKMYSLISVCVGYNVDLMTTECLLHSLGLGFNRQNKRDYAYSYLLTSCRGKNIYEANEILLYLGIEKKYCLGSHDSNKK